MDLVHYLMDALHQLKDSGVAWFTEASGKPGFVAGVCLGIVGIAIGGYASFMLRVWWGKVAAPYRPQTITQTFTTKETPAQVVRRSLAAIVAGFVVLMCLICMLVEMVLPGSVEAVLQNVMP